MDRTVWLKEMQRECEEQYDIVWAPRYGEEKAGLYSNATDQQFIHEFLSLLPQRSTILDAACGALVVGLSLRGVRVFKQVSRLEADSVKAALSRPAYQPSPVCYATGNASRWAF